MEPFICLVV